jgi:hypothetical protein
MGETDQAVGINVEGDRRSAPSGQGTGLLIMIPSRVVSTALGPSARSQAVAAPRRRLPAPRGASRMSNLPGGKRHSHDVLLQKIE